MVLFLEAKAVCVTGEVVLLLEAKAVCVTGEVCGLIGTNEDLCMRTILAGQFELKIPHMCGFLLPFCANQPANYNANSARLAAILN